MKTTFTNTPTDRDFMNTIMKALQSELPKKQLNEKLDDDDAEEVEFNWDHRRDHHVEDTIDKVFNGKSRIEYPLENTESVPHPDVEEHLNNNGIRITDYINGKGKDRYNREVNIGKALVKTKAPDQVKAAYENDPTRQQKGKQLKVVISHRPVDVAGMTSGHQSWVDQSCMNFKTGVYRGMLPHEVKAGTHVAYLTDTEDKDLDRPVARIAIKPFRNESGHLIFRPENKTYGNSNTSFTNSVHDWSEKNYPAEPDTVYEKDPHVYNDTEDSYSALTKEKAMSMIDNRQPIHGSLSPDTVSHIAHHLITSADQDPDILSKFGSTNHRIGFDRNQVNAVYSVAARTKQYDMVHRLIRNSGDVLNKKNLEHATLTMNSQHPNIIKHRYLPQEYIDSLPTEKLEHVHPANIKPHHIDRVLDDLEIGVSGSAYPARALLDMYSKDHLKKYSDINIKKQDYSSGIYQVLTHAKADDELIDHVFKNIKGIGDNSAKDLAMYNFTNSIKNPTAEHVAHTNKIPGLNDIMEKTSNKLIHHLAMHKALGIDNARVGIKLGENSDKFITDKDIPEIYDKLGKFRVDSAMSHGIHDKLLSHAESKISQLEKEYDDSDSGRSKDDIEEEMLKHFETHADMIGDKINDMVINHREGHPINHKEFETLRDHIDFAKEHPHYDGYSHEEVHSDHRDLEREINRDY